MSGIIDTTLPQLANQVRTATAANENDRERVGSLFEGIIDYIAQNEAAWLQDTGGGGGGSLSEPGALLKKLWLKGNPEAERILKYDGSDWVPIPVPSGGGSGGGMDVAAMWAALQNTTGDYANYKIPASHLDLKDFVPRANTSTWWGCSGTAGSDNDDPFTVTGSLRGGIDYIEFANGVRIGVYPTGDTSGSIIQVYRANGEAAHFFATGGVSALGNSSSGGGGGGGDTPLNLNDILTSINGSSNSVPSFTANKKYIVLGTGTGTARDWNVVENTLGRLSNVQLNNNLADGQALVYNSGGYWENRTVSSGGGTISINEIDEVADSFNSLTGGQVLTYSSGEWKNADLPTANGTGTSATMGIVKASTGLSATNGVLSVNLSTNDLPSGIPINKLESSSFGINGVNIQLGSSGNTITAYWPATKGFTINENSGRTAVLRDSGSYNYTKDSTVNYGETNGQNNITLYLKKYLQDTVVGGATKFTNDSGGGLNRYIWGKQYLLNGVFQTIKTGPLVMYDSDDDNSTAFDVLNYSLSGNNKQLIIGRGANNGATKAYQTYLDGEEIVLRNTRSVVSIVNATSPVQGLRIGDAVLYWDNDKNALALYKYNGTNSPEAANFYAAGGVSALGMSSGSGSVPAMTFGNLTVNNKLSFNSSSAYVVTGQNTQLLRILGDANADYVEMFYDSDNSKISSTQYYFTDYCNVGIKGELGDGEYKWSIDPDGCAQFSRIYLSNNAYIYFASNDVKLQIGSSTYTLTKQ